MSLVQSKQIAAGYPVPTPNDAVELMAIVGEYTVPAGGRPVNDVIEMGALPAGCIPVDLLVSNTAAGASATADVGLLSGNYGDATAATGQARTCGNEFLAAGDVNATTPKRLGKSLTSAPVSVDTGWGLKVTGATWAAGTTVRAVLFAIPAPVAM